MRRKFLPACSAWGGIVELVFFLRRPVLPNSISPAGAGCRAALTLDFDLAEGKRIKSGWSSLRGGVACSIACSLAGCEGARALQALQALQWPPRGCRWQKAKPSQALGAHSVFDTFPRLVQPCFTAGLPRATSDSGTFTPCSHLVVSSHRTSEFFSCFSSSTRLAGIRKKMMRLSHTEGFRLPALDFTWRRCGSTYRGWVPCPLIACSTSSCKVSIQTGFMLGTSLKNPQ